MSQMYVQDPDVPVITIDGGAKTGKSTARAEVARRLGWHGLDSGALFRTVACECMKLGYDLRNEPVCSKVAYSLNFEMEGERIYLDGIDYTNEIRSDRCGRLAQEVAKLQGVHDGVRHCQLQARKLPGLVADGRDQGEIFHPSYKVFLYAEPEIRAKWRMKELQEAGKEADYDTILKHILARDHSDATRPVAPFKPHPDAVHINVGKIEKAKVPDVIIKGFWRSQYGKQFVHLRTK